MTPVRPLALLAALFLLDPAIARLSLASEAQNTEFTLPFKVIDNRVFVDVRLNGKGPFQFILDTGAEAVVSEQVANRLGLRIEDMGEGQGVGASGQHLGQTLSRAARAEICDEPVVQSALRICAVVIHLA
jgi:hypothetical protein